MLATKKTQKKTTSDETRLIVAIAYTNIYEGLYFNLYQKPRLKKVMDLARNVSKGSQLPNRKLIYKEIQMKLMITTWKGT